MVGTTNCAALDAVAAEQAAASVPAEVYVTVQRAVAIAHDDDALAGNLEHFEGTRPGKTVGAARVKPLIPEDRPSLAFEERSLPIGCARERDFEGSFGQGLVTPEGFGGLFR